MFARLVSSGVPYSCCNGLEILSRETKPGDKLSKEKKEEKSFFTSFHQADGFLSFKCFPLAW
jgi:hypothetical protein